MAFAWQSGHSSLTVLVLAVAIASQALLLASAARPAETLEESTALVIGAGGVQVQENVRESNDDAIWRQEDMSWEQLMQILELRGDSPYWRSQSHALAQTMLQITQKDEDAEDGGASNDAAGAFVQVSGTAEERARLRQRREALRDHLLGNANEEGAAVASELEEEHELVQAAVHGVLLGKQYKYAAHEQEQEEGGDFNQSIACMSRHVKVADKNPDESKKHVTEEMVADRKGQSRYTIVMREVYNEVMKKLDDAMSFFTRMLRWELAVSVFGTPELLVPTLGWKCQPLYVCIKSIVTLPAKFLKLLGTFVWALGKIMYEVAKGIARFIGVSVAPPPEKKRPTSMPNLATAGISNVELGVNLTGGAPGKTAPTFDAVDDFVKARAGALYSDAAAANARCVRCSGRLKGAFSVHPLSIISTIFTGGLVGMVKVWITTCPIPLDQGFDGCLGCLYRFGETVYSMFFGSSRASRVKYFSSGSCNAHTVGLCQALEKVHSCGMSLKNDGGITMQMNSNKDLGSTQQKAFCDSFRGVHVRLSQIEGRPQCPKLYSDRRLLSFNETVVFDSNDVTEMDLQDGCNQVRNLLEKFNRVCEAGEDRGRLGKTYAWLKAKTGLFAYNKAHIPISPEEVTLKCRTIFGCKAEDGDAMLAPKGKPRVYWEDLQSEIRSIVQRVDEYVATPRSYTPAVASKKIVDLIDRVTSSMDNFSAEISIKHALSQGHSVSWGRNLENIFSSDVWDDRCFVGLAGGKAKVTPTMTAIRRKFGEHSNFFFKKLASVMRTNDWGVGDTCTPNWNLKPDSVFIFRSSDLGMTWDETSGEVLTVASGGRAAKHGIQVGWVIFRVEAARYDSELLQNVMKLSEESGTTFSLTFATSDNDKQLQQEVEPVSYKAGPKINLAVLGDLKGWRDGWKNEVMEFHTLESPNFAELRLVKVARNWYLQHASTGFLRRGAPAGALLTRIRVQGIKGSSVKRFTEAAQKQYRALLETDELLHGSGHAEGDENFPATGNHVFDDALRIVSSWQSEDNSSVIMTKQSIAELKALVDGNEELTNFFKLASWTFKRKPGPDADPDEYIIDGVDGQTLSYDDGQQAMFQISGLRKWLKWPMMIDINPIRKTLYQMTDRLVKAAPVHTIYESANYTGGNPFEKLVGQPGFSSDDNGLQGESIAAITFVFRPLEEYRITDSLLAAIMSKVNGNPRLVPTMKQEPTSARQQPTSAGQQPNVRKVSHV